MTSFAFLFVISVAVTSSQTTICVWNSIDEWDGVNGEYTKQSGTFNEKSFWKQAPTTASCPQTAYYIYYGGNTPFWFINTAKGDTRRGHPQSSSIDSHVSNPTQCQLWVVWTHGSIDSIPLTVSDGMCPSLPCNTIQVTNTGDSQCDATFAADNTKHNVFVSSSNIYFFFNHYTFKWGCSDAITDWEDCDGSIDTFIIAKNDGWTDVSVGSSITVLLSNNNQMTLECMRDTSNPTSITTMDPTNSPSYPPSDAPSERPPPTQSPSDIDPTSIATHHPSTAPSEPLIALPSAIPTVSVALPTDNPIIPIPSYDPTGSPFKLLLIPPANDPTESPASPQQTVERGSDESVEGENNQTNPDGGARTEYLAPEYIVIGVAVCCCLLIVTMICIRRKKKRDGATLNIKNKTRMVEPTTEHHQPQPQLLTTSNAAVVLQTGNETELSDELQSNRTNLFGQHLASNAAAGDIVMDNIVCDMVETPGNFDGDEEDQRVDRFTLEEVGDDSDMDDMKLSEVDQQIFTPQGPRQGDDSIDADIEGIDEDDDDDVVHEMQREMMTPGQ